jgi:cytoskeletal protein CcmA (bactofilin family)
MWKKDEERPPAKLVPPVEERSSRSDPAPAKGASERATIGRSITIRGDVEGNEDLLIQGRVEGSVDLKDQEVTVGREGRVNANITGRVVAVEGEVEGDLQATEQVILKGSAQVQGDIKAPRVVLEDGATFRGLVDMEQPAKSQKKPDTAPAPAPAPPKVTTPEGADKPTPDSAGKSLP